MVSPAIHVRGTTGTSFITDEISVKFSKEPDLNSFTAKYNLTLIEKTPYGAYLFRTSTWEYALPIANNQIIRQIGWDSSVYLIKQEYNI